MGSKIINARALFAGLALLFVCPSVAVAQESRTFEMRYFSSDPKADGITDFHGETEILDNAGRVAALGKYAAFASRFWGDPGLNTPLFSDIDVRKSLSAIKAQPLSEVRKTMVLSDWRACGYKEGKREEVESRHKAWTGKGAVISGGVLRCEGSLPMPFIDTIGWRFRLKASLAEAASGLKISVGDAAGTLTSADVSGLGSFELYGDLPNRVLFLSSGGRTVKEIPLAEKFSGPVSLISLEGKAAVRDISLYKFVPTDNTHMPYRVEMLFNEDFEDVLSMDGWQKSAYDDSAWEKVSLPSVHGGLAEEGESWYLRTKVRVDSFERALLDIETIDPAGEVWVNGEVVAVTEGREPRKIDVGKYLRKGEENLIAVRVKPYRNEHPMHHTPSDLNTGWFLGRCFLSLSASATPVSELLVHTSSVSDGAAVQRHKITIKNDGPFYGEGSLEIKYFPWFPEEGPCVASVSREISILPAISNVFDIDLRVDNPEIWNTGDPRLYRVQVILRDKEGTPVDDIVTTTGIRVIEQKKGVLFINGKAEILGGSQNFGYRLPVETMAKTIRCASDEMVMRDLVMARRLGNLLRIHVHSEQDIPDGINDPRYAEYADQLGMYLIWQTPGWIREGEAFNVDFARYPAYMKQVYNHPSIVIWEASNHPNRFRKHSFEDSGRYFTTIISTIVQTDTSRLVSPTTAWKWSWYDNYEGTLDIEGNSRPQNPWLMHKMMTRGSQDAYTGYGYDWSVLRKGPYAWAKSCLDAKDLCYFNYEHEESAAQPNWNLARKEPWYGVPSYEQPYEKGSIGRVLDMSEWRESQAFQAFSAWESMKVQTLIGVCGFSWCSLESGPNMFTYQKPLVDPYYVPKLAFHANRMVFQRLWAASADVDTAYGPSDMVRPVIFNLDAGCRVDLTVELKDASGRTLEKKKIRGVDVLPGRSVTSVEPFRFKTKKEGTYFIVYRLDKRP